MSARKKSTALKPIRISPVRHDNQDAGAKESAEYSEQVKRHHAEYLKRLKTLTFEVPPRGFDPRKARDRELLLYGFPRQPNAERQPRLHALWQEAYSRPIKPIKPRFVIDEVLLNRYRRPRKVRDGRFAPGGWGGVVTQPSDFGLSEPATTVFGAWMVPSMQPDFDNPNTAMTVGFWVGLDGFGSSQVLQAGTAATVTGENVDYWAWLEWYPDPPVRITNFPIEPGEVIAVLVCALQPNQGYVSMLNRQTSVTYNAGIPAPAGISSTGTTAEWIVEGISADLPNWVIMGFHECTAGTKSHDMDLSHPTVTEISGATKDLTLALAFADNIVVLWEGVR